MVQQPENRIYYLDHIRNFANILRCYIHAAVPYMVTFSAMWPVDDGGSMIFDVSVFGGHLFVMEVYFLVAGFLFAMQLQQKSLSELLSDRFKKIVVPFLVLLLLIMPVVLSFFELARYSGYSWIQPQLLLKSYLTGWKVGLQNIFPTGHLWFLYYLILFYIVTIILRKCIRYINFSFSHIPFIMYMVVGIALSAFSMSFLKRWIIDNPLTLTPELPSFLHFYFFFFLGILICLFDENRTFITRYASLISSIGVVSGIIAAGTQLYFSQTNLPYYETIRLLAIVFYVLASYCLAIGVWGLFAKFRNKKSITIRYLSDASYWMYLSNLPIVMLMHLLLQPLNISIYLKFIFSFSVAFVVSIVSYQFMVRYTWIGKLIGKNRTKKQKINNSTFENH